MRELISLHVLETGYVGFWRYYEVQKGSPGSLLYTGSKGHVVIKDNFEISYSSAGG